MMKFYFKDMESFKNKIFNQEYWTESLILNVLMNTLSQIDFDCLRQLHVIYKLVG
jgi:hypothetical protein